MSFLFTKKKFVLLGVILLFSVSSLSQLAAAPLLLFEQMPFPDKSAHAIDVNLAKLAGALKSKGDIATTRKNTIVWRLLSNRTRTYFRGLVSKVRSGEVSLSQKGRESLDDLLDEMDSNLADFPEVSMQTPETHFLNLSFDANMVDEFMRTNYPQPDTSPPALLHVPYHRLRLNVEAFVTTYGDQLSSRHLRTLKSHLEELRLLEEMATKLVTFRSSIIDPFVGAHQGVLRLDYPAVWEEDQLVPVYDRGLRRDDHLKRLAHAMERKREIRAWADQVNATPGRKEPLVKLYKFVPALPSAGGK